MLTGSKAITHFYRDCSIWPRLNPSVVLAPLLQPLQATASESGGDKVQLTASLHRSYWVAGQLCRVRVRVLNNSKKLLKSVVLELFRSTTIFKRERQASGPEEVMSVSPASTTTKKVAETSIVVGDRATRGHASAKGWWTGVAPGEMQVFMHSILIPPDAVSISRGQLLEISYAIQVVLNTNAIFSSDVHVSLPIRIINFISIDPPPASPASLDVTKSLVEDEYDQRCEYFEPESEDEQYDGYEELGNLPILDDDDEVVQHAVRSVMNDAVRHEDPSRGSEIYYAALQEDLDRAAEDFDRKQRRERREYENASADESISIPASSGHVAARARRTSGFASRVEEKMLKRQATVREYYPAISKHDSEDHHIATKIESDSCPTGLFEEETGPVGIGARKPAQLSTEPGALRSTENRVESVGPDAASLQSQNTREEVIHGRQMDPPATHIGDPKTAPSNQSYGEVSDQFERNYGARIMGAGSTTASGGRVQDKIRELEERVASATA
ncbi:hypothetical protein NLJ89_g9187 [Agrocybe chaxingu]|uniref:Arrestin C-terminal-like domain-containing protein n=1 Tax=Agrocybe chaxingu TaxID=84603 RepID=A0A9W8MS26_9AGAR|nr:hypothetical protein NLJ89_g9187 [Agrocybe chaxingu]